MPDPKANMTVEQDQFDVRKITLSIETVDPSTGEALTTNRVAYRQVDSGYEE